MGWIITGPKGTDLNTSAMRTLTQKRTLFAVVARVIFRGIQVFTSSIWRSRGRKTSVLKLFSRFQNYTDYWWEKRDDRGLLRIESRSPKDAERFFEKNAPTQTFSLGISLLESAALIESHLPELAGQMRRYGSVYIDGFLAARITSKLANLSVYANVRRIGLLNVCRCGEAFTVAGTSCGTGVLCLGGWRLTQNERLMEYARASWQYLS